MYFKEEKDPTSGRLLHSAKLIPNRGAWLEFETNKRDVLSVKVDRKRKIPVTILLRAIMAWKAEDNGDGHWVPDNELDKTGLDDEVAALLAAVDTVPEHPVFARYARQGPGSQQQRGAYGACTSACAPAIRPPLRTRATCLSRCSSAPAAMTWRAWAAIS